MVMVIPDAPLNLAATLFANPLVVSDQNGVRENFSTVYRWK